LLAPDGDVPRNQEGIALIGDPRNDTQVFVSQMQVAFIAAHNRLVDRLREDGVAEPALFDEARRALTWHYQWLIVNQLVRGLAGDELVDELLRSGPRFYHPEGPPFIPLEFADAAYRYGHSQIRQLYRIQPGGELRPVFPDLIGFGPIGDRRVDWSLLFDVPGLPSAQRATPIDGRLPRSLIELPSGELVAERIGASPLTPDEVGLAEWGWTDETPLWLYVLREAAVRHDGDRLGEVGGTIVSEVLVGIIAADPESYLALEPDWTPTLPSRGERFGLADLLIPA
jgi:hypothetical protein